MNAEQARQKFGLLYAMFVKGELDLTRYELFRDQFAKVYLYNFKEDLAIRGYSDSDKGIEVFVTTRVNPNPPLCLEPMRFPNLPISKTNLLLK